MTQTESTTCRGCGRPRWTGDNYCAKCGQAFDVEFIGAAPDSRAEPVQFNELGHDSAIFDLESAEQAPSAPIKAETNRYLKYGVAGIGLLIAAVIGIPALIGGGDDLATDATPLPTFTSVPTPAPTATADPETNPAGHSEAEATAQAQTQATVEAELLAEEAAEAEAAALQAENDAAVRSELTGYVLFEDLNDLRLLDLATGDLLEPPSRLNRYSGIAAVSAHGAIVQEGLFGIFQRWDGSDPIVFELQGGEQIAMLLHDVEAGDLVITEVPGIEAFGSLDSAIQLATGERRSLELTETLTIDNSFLWSLPGNYGPTVRSTLVLSAGSQVFRWGWDTGWQSISDGSVRVQSQDGVHLIDTCQDPTACIRQAINDDGELLSTVDSTEFLVPWASSLSPGGRFVSAIDISSSIPAMTLTDLTTGDVSTFPPGDGPMVWIGPNHFLSTERGGAQEMFAVDIRTQDEARLPELDGADSGVWLPELIGIGTSGE